MSATLLITVLLEGCVVLVYSRWRGKPFAPLLLTSLSVNLITQSLLWVGLILFFYPYWLVLTALEICIWLIESLAFFRVRANWLSLKEALYLGLVVNLSSFSAGLFL